MKRFFSVFEFSDNSPIEEIMSVCKWDENEIREGKLHLRDGSVIVPGQIMHYKDIIYDEAPEEMGLKEIEPENIPIQIVYEDEYMLIVSKPAGMQSMPSRINRTGTLVNALMYHCGKENLSPVGNVAEWGLCHRLDYGTSGMLIAGKQDEAAFAIKKQLSERKMVKKYTALCCGIIKEDFGEVDASLKRIEGEQFLMGISFDIDAKPSKTRYEVLDRIHSDKYGDYTLVGCELVTGRTHQIRVHMKYLGYPLAGDPLYNDKEDVLGIGRQFLHSSYLEITHPISGEKMIFNDELSDDLKAALDKLKSVK